MAEDTTIKDLTVSELKEDKPKRGLTMGFDFEGESYVHLCGKCGCYWDYQRHESKDFFFCGQCRKMVAVRAECRKPGCECKLSGGKPCRG